MPVSVIDSRLFKNLFGTQKIIDVFDDEAYVRRCAEVEVALALAQSRVGVIPKDTGKELATALRAVNLDFEKLSAETEIVGYPILPLVRQLNAACGENVGKYIHWGATTQDIQDTATILQIQAGLRAVEEKIKSVMELLARLARAHKDTAMAGRTHMQHALPVTFGYKCAVYLSGFQRHLERLRQLIPRCLMVQFGGATGTLASLGSDSDVGLRVRRALAEELGLFDPLITWHTARDGVVEIVNFLAMVGGSLGKMATDIIIMSSNEVGEVSEPFVPHRGASSTMPQKRNPISSEVVLAASKILRSNAGLCLDGMITDFERASGPWHLEWMAVPESFVIAVGALSQMEFALSGLAVNVDAMEHNLNSTRGLIVAEAVMMELAARIGRQKAHDIVYEACKTTIDASDGRTLFDVLSDIPEVTSFLSVEKLKSLCQPGNYLGAAGRMVDDVITSVS